MKKGSKIVIIIWSIIIFSIIGYFVINSRIINRIKTGFYFEKYKTAEEAKAALLKLHPVGSDVGSLVKTLEKAGGIVKEENLERYHKSKISKKYNFWWKQGTVKMYDYKYKNKSIINPVTWGGGIRIDKYNKIIDYGVSKHYMGL